MSSMLNYFKRKLRPRCVGSPTHSLDISEQSIKNQNKEKKMDINGKLKNKSETKLSQNNKRKFNLKLKRSIKSNLHDLISGKNKSIAQLSGTESNDIKIEDELSKQLSVSEDSKRSIMETYTNCSYSPSQIIDHSKYSKALTKENFIYSTEEGDFLNSTSLGQTNSSGYVEYATSASNYTNEPGVANLSVNSVIDSNQSMVTYNTKYANSGLSDDDGLMSVDGGESMHHSSLSVSENMQQSTPYNENFARIRSLKISKQASIHKSNTFNQLAWKPINIALKVSTNDIELNESYKICKEEKIKNKCRRSNTTYTLMGSRTNNKVIDYFNKLEMSKPVKKTANIRKLGKISMVVDTISNIVVDLPKVDDEESKFKKNDTEMSETIESLSKIAGNVSDGNEVEKIQDVLFHDESSVINSNEANISLNSSLSNNLNNPNSSYALTSPPSIDSPKNLPLLSLKNQSSPQSKESVTDIKLNETHLVDCSMEKLRRTVSMPGIENNFMANVSKISIIKDEESINSNIENNTTKSFIKDSIQKMDDTNTAKSLENNYDFKTNSSNQSVCGEFIRGDPKVRTSQKNIKQMFKNVVKYQMSALDSLEKFYEKHVEKLEIDREAALKSHQESQEKINEFFDSQLKLLEDRVQSNLKFICENKSSKITPTTSNSNVGYQIVKNNVTGEINKNNLLTHKLSQMMLLKQVQLRQQQEETIGHVSRSRNLIDLKSNLINQNNILPTLINKNQLLKSATKKDEFNGLLGIKSTIYGQNFFKRNLSLRNPIDNNRVNHLLKARSPKNGSHSTSRIRFKSQEPSTYSDQTNIYQSSYTKTINSNKSQFQKNVGLRKNYSSSESIAKMVQGSSETLNNSELIKQLLNSNNNIFEDKVKIESSNSSTYSKIKRQNKSVNSLKHEEFNTPESCGFGNFKLQEESRNHFRLNYSRNSSIYNSSMRNTSNLNGTYGDSGHLIKYLPPRFSDAHIHLKLNQQKLAVTRNELKYLNQKYLSQLQNVPKSLNDLEKSVTKLTMPFETSV